MRRIALPLNWEKGGAITNFLKPQILRQTHGLQVSVPVKA